MNTDSVKSPTIEATAVIKLINTTFQYSQIKISGKIIFNKIPHAIEVIIPPKNPTKLLFGLAGIKVIKLKMKSFLLSSQTTLLKNIR